MKNIWKWTRIEVDKKASGAILAVARKINGLSSSNLADALQVTQDSIKKYESGKATPAKIREIASNYWVKTEMLTPSMSDAMRLSYESTGDCLQLLLDYYRDLIHQIERNNVKQEKGMTLYPMVTEEDISHCRLIKQNLERNEHMYREEYYLRLAGLYKGNNQKLDKDEYKHYLENNLSSCHINVNHDELFAISNDIAVLRHDLIKIFTYRTDNSVKEACIKTAVEHAVIRKDNTKNDRREKNKSGT